MQYTIKEYEAQWNGIPIEILLEATVEPHTRTLQISKVWYNLPLPRMTFLILCRGPLPDCRYRYGGERPFLVGVPTSDDRFIDCPLPNSVKGRYPDVCLGKAAHDLNVSSSNPKDIIDTVLSLYYSSPFKLLKNPSYDGNYEKDFYEKWQRNKVCPHYKSDTYSFENLRFYLGANFRRI
jgi:hypothetical protein